ncbi:MAG TPA: hypothetical protein VGF18_08980 [Candidatus Tumulicola sp.]
MRRLLLVVPIFALAACSAGGSANILQARNTFSPSNISPDKRGKIALFDDPAGDPTPTGITTGPDGALWFTDPGNDFVGRITTQGQYTLQQMSGTELGPGIASGSDGNLWFTVAVSEGGIGSITTGGQVTLYDDSGGSYTQYITSASDGTLWFTESNGTLGHRSKNGTIKHFHVGASNTELEGIVQGPDGNFWMTEFAIGSHESNRVYRVSAKGNVKAFKVGAGPLMICVGPDKALWFTESGSGGIGRLTTSGKYTDFSLQNPSGGPIGIAAGPDKALWFTEGSSGALIGRITTFGKITRYGVTGDPSLQNITQGPDGAMWFTSEMFPSAVGRITTK